MSVKLPEAIEVSTRPDLSQSLTSPTTIQTAGGEFQIQRLRLTDGASCGVELLLVDSGKVRAAICPTRGLGLWKANIEGLDCGWKSAVEGPIHPSFVALDDGSGLGWLDGFDELLVRCGLRSFGAPDFDEQGHLQFGLHGRIANLPARNVQVNVDQEHSLLEVIGEVHESRFLQYNLRLKAKYVFAIGEPTIEVRDTVVNAGATATAMQMLYHINVGAPLLEAGAKFHISADRAVARDERAAKDLRDWATYRAPTAGYQEQVYFYQGKPESRGWAKSMLSNKDASKGFAVHYHTETLPFFTQWKNTVAESDGYVTGFEPGTGFPNPRSFEEEQGRVPQLGPGESVDFLLKLEGLATSESVAARASEVQGLAGSDMQTVDFDAAWCTPR